MKVHANYINLIGPQHFAPEIQKDTTTTENSTDSSTTAQEDEQTQSNSKENETRISQEFTASEKMEIEQLSKRDTAVRAHERAHISSGGQYIRSGAIFKYQNGPDGNKYAVGGEVSIDTSAIPGNPEATSRKMRVVRAAALAPIDPSPQDRAVATEATQLEAISRLEYAKEKIEARASSENNEDKQNITTTSTIDQYSQQTQDYEEPGSVINVFG